MSEGMKRRDFLKVLGVTGAGATVAGCSTGEVERLIPYVVPPEEIVPGVPTWYTTTCRECPAGCSLHVETHSGRTTKVEGNPYHPISHGNTCARGQASVQGLYHPDRWQGPQIHEPGVRALDVSWLVAERQVAERIQELRDAGRADRIVYLTGDYTGTMNRLVNDWVQSIGARRVIYEPFAEQPRFINFSDADVLISFGADFLETWGSPVDYSWQYAAMKDHRINGRGKFIWVAPHQPLTGLNADQWIAPKPGTEPILAYALAGEVDPETAARETGLDRSVIDGLLAEMQGRKVVALGPGATYSSRDTTGLRDAINRLNALTVPNVATGVRGANRAGGTKALLLLLEQMYRGEVELLLIDGRINPAYTLPGAAQFADAMDRVPMRVSFSTFPDETSMMATHILPSPHFLEEWDDYVPQDGVYLLVQPTMRPVFNTKQTGDVLLNLARMVGIESVSAGVTATTYYDYLRENWRSIAPGEDWREAVKRGGVWPALERDVVPAGPGFEGRPVLEPELTAGAPVAAAAAAAVAPAATPGRISPAAVRAAEFTGPADAAFHLIVYPSYRFFDGSLANRPWLLELPDPVTKIAWESWVEMHPRAARELGIDQGDLVEIASEYGKVEIPVFIYPGLRPDTVAIQMGLGHDAFGRFTEGRGVNPNRLLGPDTDAATEDAARYGLKVKVVRLGGRELYAKGVFQGIFEGGVRTQYDREIAQAVSLATVMKKEAELQPTIPGEDEIVKTLKGNGGFVPIASETDPSSYPPPGTEYGEYVEGSTRWGMVVDLNRCIGCSACVVACYAENNIPVVGPEQMARGREMSWLRIERYFSVSRDEADAYEDDATQDVRFLPMLCQHCNNAPCEPVCPVYAAYHTPDGLNGQVYNRCVGTRYCANNCPYKVRYFNWYTYDFVEPLNWQLNPDVAVREKGVMEKCTFCVQRIRDGERRAQLENRPVVDGEVVPACVQTCPTEVFVFGNMADPNSNVSKAAQTVRGYRALELLNTQPAIVYLKKVTLAEPEVGGHHAAEPAAAGAESH